MMTYDIQIMHMDRLMEGYPISIMNSTARSRDSPAKQARVNAKGSYSVIHEIFARCAEVIQDPFWTDKFVQASYGKFPSKFSYRDGVLYFQKGAKSASILLPENPHEAAHISANFFRTYGGIYSPVDESMGAMRHQEEEPLTWETAGSKTQELLLSYYYTNMKNVMKLDKDKVDQLKQIVRIGISNKVFGKHNIIVQDNKIYAIQGLLRDDKSGKFYIDPELKPPSKGRTYVRKKEITTENNDKDTIPQFIAKWDKYAKELEKKVEKYTKNRATITISHTHSITQGDSLDYNSLDYSIDDSATSFNS